MKRFSRFWFVGVGLLLISFGVVAPTVGSAQQAGSAPGERALFPAPPDTATFSMTLGAVSKEEGIDDSLLQTHQSFWSAFAARDLWSLSQIWDTSGDQSSIYDAITAIFPGTGNPAVGWSSISDELRRAFNHHRSIKIDAKLIRAHRIDDVAWLISAVRFESIQTQTGQPVLMDRMLTTEIYTRKNGKWAMVHYHGHYPGFRLPEEFHLVSPTVPTMPPRAESDIWQTYDGFATALVAKDIPGMLNVFSPDQIASAIQPASAVPFLGPENVIASWKKTFSDIESLSFDPKLVRMSTLGSVGWITDLCEFHIVFKDNPNVVRHFHKVMTTFILHKNNGAWEIVHYHAHIGVSYEDEH